jgi:catechol 2,3-dioxygenase
MRIGYVSLNVSDLQKSLDFYRGVLGFKVLGRPSTDRVLLTADGNARVIELLPAAKPTDGAKRAGLYHLAILLPERKYLADILRHLAGEGDKIHFDGLADHLVSESIYIRDPDSIGVEIYCDRDRSEWRWNDGRVEMATLRLDTDNLFQEATATGWKEMPEGTAIGHVHLHVSNLSKALSFYRDTLGLELTATYPSAYFFAAKGYHHHIAVNTWLGTAISKASPDAIGLNHFAIGLPTGTDLERTAVHLGEQVVEHQLRVADPDGIMIILYSERSAC